MSLTRIRNELQSVKKELEALKKELAPGYQSIEQLLKVSDLKTLADGELFRILKYYDPSLTTLEDMTDEILEEMASGEHP